MSQEIIVYGNEMCPMVPPVRDLLERASAPYTYISITRNGEARARVQEINRGNASVPTLVFPDGSALTEPKLADLSVKLEALGHIVRPATRLDRIILIMQDHMIRTLGIIFLAIGMLGNQPSMTIAGAALLAVMVLGMVLKRINR